MILAPAWLNIYFADASSDHKRILILMRRPLFLHPWEVTEKSLLISFHRLRWTQVPHHFSRTTETSYTRLYTGQSHHVGPACCIYYQSSYFKNWRWQMSMFCSCLQVKNDFFPPLSWLTDKLHWNLLLACTVENKAIRKWWSLYLVDYLLQRAE